ncbi:Signal transduction histidine kinase [Thiothrix eikelboomii]|uniref:Signal transduction histidine kinase n=1 Tax=Thiothrix eikelboomii TaxID=92487 RepID=A0A1T4X9E5_9GAMM|nr:hybrid sensor histidine kinase/response regulator [Thiothrix eikelboomii]SKA86206.1 Signal transduction histidine kinase [Thiothrix eikelboomii]
MNENNINQSTTQGKEKKEKWEVVADVLDHLQSFVITERAPRARDVIKNTAQLITDRVKDFSIPNLQFSIIYQSYRDLTLNVELERGQVIPETQTLALEASALSSYQDRIETVVATGVVDSSTSNYLIVPMRLDPRVQAIDGQDIPPHRVVGAFLLESDKEYVFQEKDARLFDRFSDGCAVLIQLGDSKARTEVTNKLHSEYLGSIGQFKSELEIFKKLVDSLTNNEIRYSYAVSEINILLYHSFYQDQLYIVCEDGELKSDFRKENSYSSDSDKIKGLFGNHEAANDIIEFTSSNYPSNIIVPILVHNDNKIGYLILRTQQKNAYQNEKNLLRRTAGFLAATLRSFRHDTWEQQLDRFFIQYIENNVEDEKSWTDLDNIKNEKSQADEKLYNAVVRVLEHIYGSVELAIVYLSLEDKTPTFTFRHGENWDEVNLLTELKKYINELNLEPFHSENKQYYIYSITAESGRITNFVIIKITRDSVKTTHRFIQHLLAMVGVKQSFMRKKERLISLTKFGEAITNEPNITLERAYELAYKYIKKVMSTTNIYIALLNKKNQEITFPLFKKKNEKTGKIEDVFVKPRVFDHAAGNLPRTEYILATKKPILINTKEESIEWYRDHGDSEQLGDPFASWIGVPIISEGEAIGVIAVYHPSTEYLYTPESDGVFLENIAIKFSSLLVKVDLDEKNKELEILNENWKRTNRKLEDAQLEILEKESLINSSIIAQDLTHRLNNSLGSLDINIEQAIDDINLAIKNKKIDHLYRTCNEYLADASGVVKILMNETKAVVKSEPKDINLSELIFKLIKQIKIQKRVDYCEFYLKLEEGLIVNAIYQNLVNCIYSVIENAVDAVIEKHNLLYDGLYVKIVTEKVNDYAVIEVQDNGIPIPFEIKESIFNRDITGKEYGTGYGLWRARSLAKTMKGSLVLLDTGDDDVKLFRMEFPCKKIDKNLVLVVEDEIAWRNILYRWLTEFGFEVQAFGSYETAVNFIQKMEVERKIIKLAMLDIALDRLEPFDVSGLELFNELKKYKDTKVLILTAFPKRAKHYEHDMRIIEKISEQGTLTKSRLQEELRSIGLLESIKNEN